MLRLITVALPLLFLTISLLGQAPPVDGSRFSPKHARTCEVNVVVPDLIQYWEGTFPVYTGTGVDDASMVRMMRLDTDDYGVMDLMVVADTTKVSTYELSLIHI